MHQTYTTRRNAGNSFARNHNTVRHTKRNLGSISQIVIVSMLTLIFGLIYVAESTKATSFDYEISKVEDEITEMNAKKDDLAVEKARSSRLETVNQVKQAYYGVLLAKEANKVYKDVYDNAVANCELTEKKYNVSRASELDLARAKTAVANAVPNLYDSDNAIALALWQLKAVMGIGLDENIDVADSLLCYGGGLEYKAGDLSLENNSTMRQLELQAEQIAQKLKVKFWGLANLRPGGVEVSRR